MKDISTLSATKVIVRTEKELWSHKDVFQGLKSHPVISNQYQTT